MKEENATRAKSVLAGNWQPLGKWAMVKGSLTCAKYRVNGVDKYVLFDGYERIGMFDSFDDARREDERIKNA